MSKIALWLALSFSFSSSAQTSQYLNGVNSFLNAKVESQIENEADLEELDIAYQYVVPQYEEEPDPEKQIVIEYYFSEYDGSEHSKRKIQWIKELLSDDKAAASEFGLEALAFGPNEHPLEESERIEEIQELLEIKNIRYENMHEGIDFKLEENASLDDDNDEDNDRKPSSVANPRNFWTLVRFTASSGAVFSGLFIAEGVAPAIAASAAFLPGIASGGINYFSGQFGNWLTNGKWSGWLVNSDTFLARTLRAGFGLNAANFQKSLQKNKKMFQRKYPDLYSKMPEYFEKEASNLAGSRVGRSTARLSNLVGKLHSAEEYVKWWVTEILFSGTIKASNAALGLGKTTSLLTAATDVVMAGTMGLLAQGPGDIAIQLRKFQEVEELGDLVKQGKVANETAEIMVKGEKVRKTLLEEIEMVLAKNGPFKDYSIGNFSHKLLQKIENRARVRGTTLAFFSIAGVGMEIAHIPLARPWLIGVGIAGGTYYANVRGWVRFKVPERLKNFYRPFRDGLVKMNMRSLFARFCQGKFAVRAP